MRYIAVFAFLKAEQSPEQARQLGLASLVVSVVGIFLVSSTLFAIYQFGSKDNFVQSLFS